MKFRIACDDFSQMLGRLQGFLRERNTLSPILSNVHLLVYESGVLHLSATDTELSFHGTLAVKDQAPGAITVDGKRLFSMVKQLPAEEVQVSADAQHNLSLRSGRSQMALLGLDAAEYPEQPSAEGAPFFGVKGGALAELFDRTLFSASADDKRPNLNGVFLFGQGDGFLSAVSTDGHRLTQAFRQVNLEGQTVDAFPGQIVPRKAVSELKRLLVPYPEVQLAIHNQSLIAQTTDFTVFIRLLAEKFPPYEAVIPRSNDHIYIIERAPLLNALKRMNLMRDDQEKLHGVSLEFTGSELLLESSNANLGQVEDRLELLEGSGDHEMKVAFCVQYMIEILTAMKGEQARLCLASSERTAGIFRDPEWERDLFVVMPRRL